MKIPALILTCIALASSLQAERIYTPQHTYETGKVLGKGKRGAVMIATDETGELFAAKAMFTREEQKRKGVSESGLNHMFSPEGTSKTAERAFMIGMQMDHPGIIKCYEITFHGGRNWTFLEYVPGKGVNRIPYKTFDKRTIYHLALDYLDALSYAATQDIVHRDLCMQNLMVTKNNRLKLIDLDSFHSLHEDRGGRKPKPNQEYINKINVVFLELLKRGPFKEKEVELLAKKIKALPKDRRFRDRLNTPMTPESAPYFRAYFRALRSLIPLSRPSE